MDKSIRYGITNDRKEQPTDGGYYMNIRDMKICVYTCITGSYDSLCEVQKENGIDYICFTNNADYKSESWNVIRIEDNTLSNVLLARKTKIVMNDYIKSNYDIAVWIDGASYIRGSVWDFLEYQCDLNQNDMVVFKHSERDCVYDEAVAIVRFRKDTYEHISKAVEYLRRKKHVEHFGLTETTVMVRKTNSETVNKAMELWYELLLEYTHRDQMFIDYSLHTCNVNYQTLDYNVFDNEWFGWNNHRNKFGFDIGRVYFDEYTELISEGLSDVKNSGDGNEYKYEIKVKRDCSRLELETGQLEHGYIKNVKVNGTEEVLNTNCLMCWKGCYLLGDDPLIVALDKSLSKGDEINISYELYKLDENGYRSLLLDMNNELIAVSELYREATKADSNKEKPVRRKLFGR